MIPPKKRTARRGPVLPGLVPAEPPLAPLRPDLAEALAGKKPTRRNQDQEHRAQVGLFQMAELAAHRYPELRLLFAVPNGARTSQAVAGKLKAEGLKKGVPDLVLPTARVIRVEDVVLGQGYPEPFRDLPGGGIPLARLSHGLFLEMKAAAPLLSAEGASVDYGRVKPAQIEWARALMRQGYAVAFAWGSEAAFQVLVAYLEGKYVQRAEPWKREGGRG